MKWIFRKSNLWWLCLFIIPVLGLWQVTFVQYSMKWDMLDFFYPWRFHIGDVIRNGLLPLWNPYQNLGYPIYADPQSGAWYPVTWLIGLLGGYSLTAIHLEYVLHVFLAGIGMFGFASYLLKDKMAALIIAVAFQGCGIFIGNAQHLSWIISAAWTPFVLHYFLRSVRSFNFKNAVLTGLFMALMMTGGYPIFSLILHYFLFLVFLFFLIKVIRQKKWKLTGKYIAVTATVYIFFLTISAGYLYSFLEVMPHITRSRFTLEEARIGAYTLHSFITLIFPFASAKSELFDLDMSMINIYFGLVPLIFFLFSFFATKPRYYWTIFLLGIISLMIALADIFPFRDWLFKYVPMMDTFRFAALFRFFAIIAFLVLAGVGIKRFLKNPGRFKNPLLYVTVMVGAIIAFVTVYSFLQFPHPWLPPFWDTKQLFAEMKDTQVYQHILFQGCIQILVLAAVFSCTWNWEKLSYAKPLLMIIVFADLLFATQLNVPVTVVSDVKAAEVRDQLDQLPEGFPVPALNPVGENNDYGLWINPIWYNLNTLYRRPSFLGFNSFKLSSYNRFSESTQSEQVLQNPLAYFPSGTGEVEIKKFNPNRIELKVNAFGADSLVLLQNLYNGWSVSIDGRETSIRSAHNTFMKIGVPAGSHDIVFSYSRNFVLPLLILSWVGTILAILFYFRLNRKVRPAHSPEYKNS